MRIDKTLVRDLAQRAWIANEVAGGTASTEMKVDKKEDGVEISIQTASLTNDAYHLEINDNQLILYTSYGSGRLDKEGNTQRPTAVRVFPLDSVVNRQEIDAVFENGILHIYLPFSPGKTGGLRQEIPIRTRYNF